LPCLADKTSNLLGVNEMLIASSVNGFLFGFVSGQPLLILGPTGPFLVFEEMVYDVSRYTKLICDIRISFSEKCVNRINQLRVCSSVLEIARYLIRKWNGR